ncbi:glycyl-radical enzyme activating protein [Oribacterium sp. C9]|uniref:(2S)-3-sulfopropanediol dehydratase activating enzyme n=1 Tax=Oribacterium sp. C9 TaxID=1943579 RepID=UPI00098F8CCF|nr:glycyl-radical enzyme activating protein [Oribacterium sp. C9]OON85136.1 glycyl-radical enzyme activating protein [Oribacterium sp. C9]
MSTEGIVFNIQRFTIHDGPGMRTELFLKGCPLRCRWCSNPESQKPGIEPGLYKKKCIGLKQCGACKAVCPKDNVLQFFRNKPVRLERADCQGCMVCGDNCPSDAIRSWGKKMSVQECMEIILRDKGYYEESGGGVTVSGGEPLLQADFVRELFKRCKEENIHTCLESTFSVSWNEVEKVLPYTDLVISDLKLMNSTKHRVYTGVGNELIRENLKKLSGQNIDTILRIPVIPHINDDEENIKASADFIKEELNNNIEVLQLLSFMRLGIEKYESLGQEYPMKNLKFNRPSFQRRVEKIAEYFNERGIKCLVGTRTGK